MLQSALLNQKRSPPLLRCCSWGPDVVAVIPVHQLAHSRTKEAVVSQKLPSGQESSY